LRAANTLVLEQISKKAKQIMQEATQEATIVVFLAIFITIAWL